MLALPQDEFGLWFAYARIAVQWNRASQIPGLGGLRAQILSLESGGMPKFLQPQAPTVVAPGPQLFWG